MIISINDISKIILAVDEDLDLLIKENNNIKNIKLNMNNNIYKSPIEN